MSLACHLPKLSVALSLVAIAGCAVQSNPGKPTQFGLDQAAVFGRDIEEFALPDGTDVRIRQYNNHYSVKFAKYARVVEIEKATSVRFKSAQEVGGYTLIILEKSERNCAYKTHLLAVRGPDIRSWDFGNCRARPETAIYADTATFDITEGGRPTRYQFSEGRLLYGDFVPPAVQTYSHAPSPQAPAIANGSAPGKSQTPASGQPAPRPKSGESQPAPGRQPAQTALVLGPKPVFKQKEQAPITIRLDNQ